MDAIIRRGIVGLIDDNNAAANLAQCILEKLFIKKPLAEIVYAYLHLPPGLTNALLNNNQSVDFTFSRHSVITDLMCAPMSGPIDKSPEYHIRFGLLYAPHGYDEEDEECGGCGSSCGAYEMTISVNDMTLLVRCNTDTVWEWIVNGTRLPSGELIRRARSKCKIDLSDRFPIFADTLRSSIFKKLAN